MQIIGYHFTGNKFVNSLGEISTDNPLDFLLKHPEALNVFYNLDWAVAKLLYLLYFDRKQGQQLWNTNKLFIQGYKFFYLPHRYFGLSYGRWRECNFSDVFQYDVDLPFEVDGLEAAKQAQELGQQVYDTLVKIGLNPTSLSSPVSAFQKEILSTLDLPTVDDLPPEVAIYAYKCLDGGWQEAYSKGHFQQTWDYDITSCYPHYISNLVDFRHGKWIKSNKFYPDAPYGFCKGTVRIDKTFSPIVFDGKEEQYTPTGQWQRYLTNKQISQLYKHEIGQFKIDSAWYFIPDKLVYPLKENMENLFEWKQELKGIEREVVKRILNGCWGKFSEIYNDGNLGQQFCPPFAAEIETQPKIQVTDFVISNHVEDNLLSIAVDGCLLNKKVDIPESDAMGSWRLNLESSAFVVSAGIGAVKGKQGHGTFSMSYDWLKQQIENNPNASEYTMSKITPVTLGNALKNNKVESLGELETTQRSVILDVETKRLFEDLPKNGGDLLNNQYESMPLDVELIKLQQNIL
jgi:hypothetical protein